MNDLAVDNLHPLFRDVYGDHYFKQELEDIVLAIQNKQVYYAMGAKPPKTFLLVGPPGVGKTYSVRAISNELRMRNGLERILCCEYNIGQVGTAYINMGSVNLQKIFDAGRKALECADDPCRHVLYFFDECDAIMGARGTHYTHKEDDKILETLMKNLQRINDSYHNEYLFFATNHPELLDKASVRTGRINRKIVFKEPTYAGRKTLFEGCIEEVNRLAGYRVVRQYHLDLLAEQSKGFSCSDIRACVQNALDTKIRMELRRKTKGTLKAYWIAQKSLERSIREVQEQKDIDKPRRVGFA